MSTLAPFIDAAVSTLSQMIADANTIANKVITADNATVLVHEVRDETPTEDATILAYREWFDKANAAILAKQAEVEKYIVENGFVDTTPVDVEAETANFKALDAQIKATTGLLKTMNVDESVLAGLPERKSLPGMRKSNSGGGTSDTRRPRFTKITVDGVDVFETVDDKTNPGQTRNVTNMTVLGKYLSKANDNAKVETKDLQAAAFAAAGTTDLSTVASVEFAFNVGENTYQVVAFPKSA